MIEKSIRAAALFAVLGMLALAPLPVVAQATAAASAPLAIGPSGLPVPRFVTLKAARVNVRVGPGQNYPIAWVFTRPGLPVEVIQEYDNWRRIRDSEGSTGWVFQSLLSGKRTVVVAPWDRGTPMPITAAPKIDGRVTAFLEPGVLAGVERCRDDWCELADERFAGWIQQERLWGVYPHEVIE